MSETNNFTLRLPQIIDEKLGKEAKKEHRSKTRQIIAILEERYAPKQQSANQQVAQAA